MFKRLTDFKRALSALLAGLLLALCMPAASALIDFPAGIYLTQATHNTCTLASATMMLRRKAYLDGKDWKSITEKATRPVGWTEGVGLNWNFTYKGMVVRYSYDALPRTSKEKEAELIRLLQVYPEGIVIYDRTRPHAVLLTDYTNGVFYVADPASRNPARVPLSSISTLSLSNVTCYWYILGTVKESTSNRITEIQLYDITLPINLKQGSGMSLDGTVACSDGAKLRTITVSIQTPNGDVLQSAKGNPNGTDRWSMRTVDSQIRFGQLKIGMYNFCIDVEDTGGKKLHFKMGFSVTDEPTAPMRYSSTDETVIKTAPVSNSSSRLKVFSWLDNLFTPVFEG